MEYFQYENVYYKAKKGDKDTMNKRDNKNKFMIYSVNNIKNSTYKITTLKNLDIVTNNYMNLWYKTMMKIIMKIVISTINKIINRY